MGRQASGNCRSQQEMTKIGWPQQSCTFVSKNSASCFQSCNCNGWGTDNEMFLKYAPHSLSTLLKLLELDASLPGFAFWNVSISKGDTATYNFSCSGHDAMNASGIVREFATSGVIATRHTPRKLTFQVTDVNDHSPTIESSVFWIPCSSSSPVIATRTFRDNNVHAIIMWKKPNIPEVILDNIRYNVDYRNSSGSLFQPIAPNIPGNIEMTTLTFPRGCSPLQFRIKSHFAHKNGSVLSECPGSYKVVSVERGQLPSAPKAAQVTFLSSKQNFAELVWDAGASDGGCWNISYEVVVMDQVTSLPVAILHTLGIHNTSATALFQPPLKSGNHYVIEVFAVSPVGRSAGTQSVFKAPSNKTQLTTQDTLAIGGSVVAVVVILSATHVEMNRLSTLGSRLGVPQCLIQRTVSTGLGNALYRTRHYPDLSNPYSIVKLEAQKGNSDNISVLEALQKSASWLTLEDIQELLEAGKISDHNTGKPLTKSDLTKSIQIEGATLCVSYIDTGLIPDLDIIYEDEAIVCINKPSGIPVQPQNRYRFQNIMAALHKRYRQTGTNEIDCIPRPAHRLDTNTSGTLVVALDRKIAARLSALFETRKVKKHYSAIVFGQLDGQGIIDAPIAQIPQKNIDTKDHRYGFGIFLFFVISRDMSTATIVSALVHWKTQLSIEKKASLQQQFGRAVLCQQFWKPVLYPLKQSLAIKILSSFLLSLPSGRTHQLRVHSHHMGHSILFDSQYRHASPNADAVLADITKQTPLRRCALHCDTLEFVHPATLVPISITSPWPTDFAETVSYLRRLEEQIGKA
eukprot:gene1297-4502_t